MSAITAGMVRTLRAQTGAGMMDCKAALAESGGEMDGAIAWLRRKGQASAARKSGRAAHEGLVGCAIDGIRGALVRLNTETDFVARNPIFSDAVARIARAALHAPHDAAGFGETSLSESGETVAAHVRALSAQLGENIVLSEVLWLDAPEGGRLATYLHNKRGADAGDIAVLVALNAPAGAQKAQQDWGRKLAMHIAAARPLALTRESVDAETLRREREIAEAQAKDAGKPEAIIEKIVKGRLEKFYRDHVLMEQDFIMESDTSVGDALKAAARDTGGVLRIADFAVMRIGDAG